MNAKELRGKQPAELREELMKLRREQFNLRMARATGQPPKNDQWTKVRRNIARLKFVLAEKHTGAAKTATKAAAKR
jgi:large subunit ribosomal protein L29